MAKRSQAPDRLTQLIDFLGEIERYKTIERALSTTKPDRRESDAEHSWHLAMFVWLLAPEIDPTLDQRKLFKLVLMHDLVEIYAGDAPAFDEAAQVGKADREARAADQLFRQLPVDLEEEFHALFQEFEQMSTPEARIAQAFDKLQPIVQNIVTGGRGWQEYRLTASTVHQHKHARLPDDPVVQLLYQRLMTIATERQLFYPDSAVE